VVAWRLGATPDFILDGRTGYTVAVGDLDALTDRLGRLLADPNACARMGRRGRALVRRAYTWPRTHALMWRSIQGAIAADALVKPSGRRTENNSEGGRR